MRTLRRRIDWQTLREVAVATESDPRTVAKRICREPIRGRALARRIDEELARRGLIVAGETSQASEPTPLLDSLLMGAER